MVETDALTRRHFLISGRVQGVGYRYSMRQKASQLGVTGWCRNLPDGSVEAEVYGPPQAVEALLAWCNQGPEHSRVSDVQVKALPLESPLSPTTFDIRR